MATLVMSESDREAVSELARSSTAPHRVVVQARALLALAEGRSVRGTARDIGSHQDTVTRWRDRFIEKGVVGIGTIAAGRGRKPEISTETVEAIVEATLKTVPDDGSVCWSTRTLGAKFGVGKDTVQRIWHARKLRPWKVDTFNLSNDPNFEAKLISSNENTTARSGGFMYSPTTSKTQCQALDRTQPSLPMKPGRGKTKTHDYKRNGTLDLFAAMNLATGEVLHRTRRTHTGADVLSFFKWIDAHVDRSLDVHVVLDNLSAHKCEAVQTWLAHPKRKRWHLHFTPTSSSWLNLIETWLSILTRKALTNTSFNSVKALDEAIDVWASNWNHDPQPFVWTKNANDIIDKVRRGRAALTALTESATDH